MDQVIFLTAGALGVMTALLHGYLGEARIIAPAVFPNRQARAFARAIWQFSTVTWVAGSLAIAATPFLFADPSQRMMVLLIACLPMVYGVICNAWISQGRHFGWIALSVVLGLTALGAGVSN